MSSVVRKIFNTSATKKLFLVVIAGVFMFSGSESTIFAIPANDLGDYNRGAPAYDSLGSDACAAGGGSQGTGSSGAAGSTYVAWSSGLQPPYIMEQYVIEILKYIADFKQVPREDVVTPEHTLALLAWAWGEGGDINNSSVFNLFNTSALRNDPEAMPYAAGGRDGRLAYANFDTGIKATAGNILGGTSEQPDRYSRVWQTLLDRNSTAEDVLYAYAHYTQYPGNGWWAAQNEIDGEEAYYQKELNFLSQFRRDYGQAATVIGTQEREQQTRNRLVDRIHFTELLNGSTGSGSSGGGGLSGGSECVNPSGGTVVEIAEREFAAGARMSDDSYLKYTTGRAEAWCAWFVSWVYKESGNPFSGGTGDGGWAYPSVSGMHQYAISQGWFHEKGAAGFTPQPGDIAIYNEGVGAYPSHVNIVISYDAGSGAYVAIGGNEGSAIQKQEHSMASASLTGFMRVTK
jgi:hypothetical protein